MQSDNAASATPTPIVTTIHPWQMGDFQKGIQLYWHMRGPWHQQVRRANQQLDYVAGLGANSVGVTFSIYTDGLRPSYVYRGRRTPSSKALGMLVRGAQARGLRVLLRPLIYEGNITAQDPQAWRGSIRPVDVGQWFASYDKLMVRYAALAARLGVQEFVAGTELNSLQAYTSEWQGLQERIRRAGYHGVVSYALNWDAPTDVPFHRLGIDAYPSVSLGDGASVRELTHALTGWLQQRSAHTRHRLTLQEVGIPSLSGVYAHPWVWDSSAERPNFAVQARWFTAMGRAAEATGVLGVYYWSVDSNMDVTHAHPLTDYPGSFVGKLAEQSIRRFFNQ